MSVALYNTAVKITALGGLGALAAYAVNTCVLRSETPASAVTAAVYTTHAANQTQEMTSTSYAHAHAQAQAQAQAQTQREADVQLGFDLRMPVILGSESKFRRQILKELHVPHSLRSADIDEYSVLAPYGKIRTLENRKYSNPEHLTLAIARAKADKIMQTLFEESLEGKEEPESLLITSDQVAVYKGEIREKPKSIEQFRTWWKQYAEAPVHACTAVVVTNTKTGARTEGTVVCQQLYKQSPKAIEDVLIERETILKCCGGFIVSDPCVYPYLSERKGKKSELMGFPKGLVLDLIEEAQRR